MSADTVPWPRSTRHVSWPAGLRGCLAAGEIGKVWEIRGKHIMDIVEIGHMNSIHSQHPYNVAPPSRDVNVGLVSPHEY